MCKAFAHAAVAQSLSADFADLRRFNALCVWKSAKSVDTILVLFDVDLARYANRFFAYAATILLYCHLFEIERSTGGVRNTSSMQDQSRNSQFLHYCPY